MKLSKRAEVREFIKRKAVAAIGEYALDVSETDIGKLRYQVAGYIADEVFKEYSFLELADIMEWKRTRVRR